MKHWNQLEAACIKRKDCYGLLLALILPYVCTAAMIIWRSLSLAIDSRNTSKPLRPTNECLACSRIESSPVLEGSPLLLLRILAIIAEIDCPAAIFGHSSIQSPCHSQLQQFQGLLVARYADPNVIGLLDIPAQASFLWLQS